MPWTTRNVTIIFGETTNRVSVSSPDQLIENIKRSTREAGCKTFDVKINGTKVEPEDIAGMFDSIDNVEIIRLDLPK